MPNIFPRVEGGDAQTIDNINQFIRALEGDVSQGVPFRCNQVNSGEFYAGEFRNVHQSARHLRVRSSAGAELATWDDKAMMLFQNLVCAGGVTLDGIDVGIHNHTGDARGTPIPTEGISDRAITLAKLAFALLEPIGRQGGSDTAFSEPGSALRDISTPFGVQIGSIAMTSEIVTVGGEADGFECATAAVSFPVAFGGTPMVFPGHYGYAGSPISVNAEVAGISAAGFTARLWHDLRDGITSWNPANYAFFWLAIGVKA